MKMFVLTGFLCMMTAQTVKSQNFLISKDYCLDQNQVIFSVPKNYVFDGGVDDKLYCIYSDQFRGLKPTYPYRLRSKDENVMVYIHVAPIYSKDSVHIYAQLAPELKSKINEAHVIHIKADFLANTDKKPDFPNGVSISYKSSNYAREAFNADTVIIYQLNVNKKKPLKDKYNHCRVIIIQKNGRGFIALYTFYNNKAKKKLNTYLRSLEKMFWYRDPDDFIQLPDPKPISNEEIQIIFN